jgi:hypothetical protein
MIKPHAASEAAPPPKFSLIGFQAVVMHLVQSVVLAKECLRDGAQRPIQRTPNRRRGTHAPRVPSSEVRLPAQERFGETNLCDGLCGDPQTAIVRDLGMEPPEAVPSALFPAAASFLLGVQVVTFNSATHRHWCVLAQTAQRITLPSSSYWSLSGVGKRLERHVPQDKRPLNTKGGPSAVHVEALRPPSRMSAQWLAPPATI